MKKNIMLLAAIATILTFIVTFIAVFSPQKKNDDSISITQKSYGKNSTNQVQVSPQQYEIGK